MMHWVHVHVAQWPDTNTQVCFPVITTCKGVASNAELMRVGCAALLTSMYASSLKVHAWRIAQQV